MAEEEVVVVAGSTDSIVLGGGCFWCLEALYQLVNGVTHVTSGYAGGTVKNPSYEAVCTGTTGHAEVVKIDFDSSTISLAEILDIFWASHDPTTPNQQGADVGPQYRSIVLYANEEQKAVALNRLEHAQPLWGAQIVTEIVPLDTFYEAETYHQNYFASNPDKAYCQIVINPKLAHFRQDFKKYLKESD